MGSNNSVNNGFPGIDGKIQSNAQVDAQIHLSLTYVSGGLFSIGSGAGRGAPDC